MKKVKNENFLNLVIKFNVDVSDDELDYGSVSIKNTVSGREFKLDIYSSEHSGDSVFCGFQDIGQMIEDEVFIEDRLDLLEEDLSAHDLDVEFYLGGDFSAEFEHATLFIKRNDLTSAVDVTLET